MCRVPVTEEVTLRGKDIDELVVRALQIIRKGSQDFYRAEIMRDLRRKGESLVDRHAGQGCYIKIILEK